MNRCTDQIWPTSSFFLIIFFFTILKLRMVFTLLNGWKYLKNNLSWYMKALWNSVSSVHKNSVVETQPCLIVYVLSMAALILQWQRWIGETIWPANLIAFLTGPLQKKKIANSFLRTLFEKLQGTTLLYEWSPKSWSSPWRDHKPTYSSLLFPSLCHLHNFNSQFSSHTVLIILPNCPLLVLTITIAFIFPYLSDLFLLRSRTQHKHHV